jgi:transmembrane sensor
LNPNVYSTGVGEQRRIVLADGSSVELNTRTKIRVDFGSGSRNVYLQEGEAFFSVAKETARPFRVFSHAAVVRALGTQFNVYAPQNDTIVTVLEGRVAVTARDGLSAPKALPVEVEAGRTARVEPEKPTTVATTRPDTAIAWRQRRLVFENEPLAGVAAEFNRYNVQQLIVSDETLAARRISGTFDPNKPDDLVGFLTQHGEVRADTAADRIVLSASPSLQTLSGSGTRP